MANDKNNVLIVASLFILFFWASSSADAQPVFGGMSVAGELCCATNLTCPGAALSGAVMELNCTDISGIAGIVAQAVTDADGAFNMSVPPEAGLLLGSPLSSSPIPCSLRVQDPLAATTNCSLLSDRILTAPLQLVSGPISAPIMSVRYGADMDVYVFALFNTNDD